MKKKEPSRTELKKRIIDLRGQISIANQEKEQIKTDYERLSAEEKQSFIKEKEQLTTRIKKLQSEKDAKQKQLDERELKKLAEAYSDQEKEYDKEARKWLKYLLYGFVFWLLTTGVVLLWKNGNEWIAKLPYLVLDIIPISAMWFCIAEFSYYSKLRNDYANRKTIAQSYHNIINSINEGEASEGSESNEKIRNKFIEKAVDVLCAPSLVDSKEPVLSKKLLKDLLEIIKSVSQKQ